MVRAMTTENPQDPQQPKQPFGALEDKSLVRVADEVKGAEDAEPAPAATTRVKMVHHASHDGENLVPGREYDLPARFADTLILAQRAKAVEG